MNTNTLSGPGDFIHPWEIEEEYTPTGEEIDRAEDIAALNALEASLLEQVGKLGLNASQQRIRTLLADYISDAFWTARSDL